MEEPTVEQPPEPRRPTLVRSVVAAILVLAFLLGSILYHDGSFATDDLGSASEPGLYRFKGTLVAVDPVAETIELQDASGTRNLHWNATNPSPGKVYVVDAAIGDTGVLEALAVTRAFLFP